MTFYELLKNIINKLGLAVRTDAQTLSDEQKAQVKENIGVPEEISDDEFLAWLNEENIVSPVATASGELYVTNNNEIYVL